jgi:hypothetical protein
MTDETHFGWNRKSGGPAIKACLRMKMEMNMTMIFQLKLLVPSLTPWRVLVARNLVQKTTGMMQVAPKGPARERESQKL